MKTSVENSQYDLNMKGSRPNDVNVDNLIRLELDNSFNVYDGKSKVGKFNKSKSLVTLASKGLKPALTSQQIL